jgi:hypothetical protein
MGEWVVERYGVDNYPLMAPYDSPASFAVYTPIEQQPTIDLTAPAQVALVGAAVTIGVVAIAAIAVYFKKRR